jgi:hypothetical protein
MSATSVFESFAARLRAFIRVSTQEPGCGGHAQTSVSSQQSSRLCPSPPPAELPGASLESPNAHEPGRDFARLALELFALQFEHNAPYRKYCEARRRGPRSVEHWSQIPAVPASAFKELELSCLSPMERTAVFHSSGTTEQRPSRHFHNSASLSVYEASLLPWFHEQLMPDFQWSVSNSLWAPAEQISRLAILTPSPVEAPHSSLVHMFETIRAAFSPAEGRFLGSLGEDGAWQLNLAATLDALQGAVDTRQPIVLLGTAFSFVHLLDHLAESGLQFVLPAGSRALETGGYKGRSRTLPKSELHSLLTARLGIPPTHIICEYGMSELGSQAYDGVAGNGGRIPIPPVAAGVSPAVEPGVPPGGSDFGLGTRPGTWAAGPGGKMPPSTAGETPAATRRGQGPDAHAAPHASRPGRCFHFPPWARAQIISPETGREVGDGETGLIRVCDLANVYSVMAIQTEDLGIRRGSGFELIGRGALAEPRGCSLLAA